MFLREAITTIKQSGTIAPSSSFLIQKMIEPINFDKKNVIVEFGTGNGCITKVLLEKMSSDSTLFSFELNTVFHNQSVSGLSSDKKLILLNESAVNFDSFLKKEAINHVDYFVSSLPLSLLKEEDIIVLLDKVNAFLIPNGKFVQFQYSLGKYSLLKQFFSTINLNFTFLNLPPAFIYACHHT